ncbi:hypothetical protein BB560_007133 [Smittium megazygosporum]|uniref:Nodulin-like domain-containing protein n=1 Tax=Smittium megazygosporum TaxID=133381 RepID=A0A2T9XYF8_9FUNG|nr:hypothetical protein BB560_007133 [Smittium megazygosporum]
MRPISKEIGFINSFENDDTSSFDSERDPKNENFNKADPNCNTKAYNTQKIYSRDRKKSIVVLLACIGVKMVVAGVFESFPVYNAHYLKLYGRLGAQPSVVALISTILMVSLFLAAPAASLILHRIGYQKSILLGIAISGIGFIGSGIVLSKLSASGITPLSNSGLSTYVWLSILFNGGMVGLGFCIPFLASIGVLSMWFKKYLAIAVASVKVASAVGGIINSAIVSIIARKYNLSVSLFVDGAIVLVVVFICSFYIKPNPEFIEKGVHVDQKSNYQPKNDTNPNSNLIQNPAEYGKNVNTISLYDETVSNMDPKNGRKTRDINSKIKGSSGSLLAAMVDPLVISLGLACFFGDIAVTAISYFLPLAAKSSLQSASGDFSKPGNKQKNLQSYVFISVQLLNAGRIAGYIIFPLISTWSKRISEMGLVIVTNLLAALCPVPLLVLSSVQAGIKIKNPLGLYSAAAIFGFFTAAFVSQLPSIVARMYPKTPERVTDILSVAFVYIIAGIFVGMQISSLIFRSTSHRGPSINLGDTKVWNSRVKIICITSMVCLIASCIFFHVAIFIKKRRDRSSRQ